MQKHFKNRSFENELLAISFQRRISFNFNKTVGKAGYGAHILNDFALDRKESVRRPTKYSNRLREAFWPSLINFPNGQVTECKQLAAEEHSLQRESIKLNCRGFEMSTQSLE